MKLDVNKSLSWFLDTYLQYLKQNWIAEKLGVTVQTLSEWKKEPLINRSGVQLKVLCDLAKIEFVMEERENEN